MLTTLDRVLKIAEKPLLAVAGFLIFFMMLHVVADVFARYALQKPITGTLEIVSNYYMIAIVFLPLALVQRQNSHIKVEVFTSLFGPRVVAVFDVVATAIAIVYVGLMGWLVLFEAIEHTLIREELVVGVSLMPVWPARWFVPVGVVFFLLSLLLSLGLHLRIARGQDTAHTDAENTTKGVD